MKLRWIFAGLLIVAAVLFGQRDGVACAFVSKQADKAIDASLVSDAQNRVANIYGKPEAARFLVNAATPLKRWLFKANAYAKTITIPTKSCVVLGPKGANTDVLAHELVHAEIAHRIGYWAYVTKLPVWFNEGAAMQVDHRPQYDLPDALVTAEKLRQLPSGAAFYAGDDAILTMHYGQAKRAVALWLERNGGNERLYQKLEQIRDGSIDFVMN